VIAIPARTIRAKNAFMDILGVENPQLRDFRSLPCGCECTAAGESMSKWKLRK